MSDRRLEQDSDLDPRIEAAMRDLLAGTGEGRTICPSEVARRVTAPTGVP